MSPPFVVLVAARQGDAPYLEWDPSRYLPQETWRRVEVHKATAAAQFVQLSAEGCDVVVQLCDGGWDEDQPGIEVPITLERLGIAFTGAGSLSFDQSRNAMKMAAWSSGVAVPAFVHVHPGDDPASAAGLRFPLLVKHPHGYNSVGLTRASRVTDLRALVEQVQICVAAYGGALVEEFIEGREFSVLVEELPDGEPPRASAPVEFVFPPGETFKHFDLKWKDHDQVRAAPVEDPELAQRLRDAAVATFSALRCEGYSRFDLRTDADGTVFLLESNANPGLFYPDGAFASADFILAREPGGHAAFLRRQIEVARQRRDQRRPRFRLGFDRDTGFGLRAARDLPEGELVVPGEEQPQVLVTRAHAERTWPPQKRRWLDTYAWPISDAVWATWTEDPELWWPVNHSCDPNLWLEGLDAVTRRPVQAGQELTMDYATFCGPGMDSFDCRCGSSSCRGRVTADDLFLPELQRHYQGRLSAHVEERLRSGAKKEPPTAS